MNYAASGPVYAEHLPLNVCYQIVLFYIIIAARCATLIMISIALYLHLLPLYSAGKVSCYRLIRFFLCLNDFEKVGE